MINALNNGVRRVPSWAIYVLIAFYVAWQFYLAVTQAGRYRVEPINELEREYGETALKLLVLGLAITPLRAYAGINLIKFRRAIGVSAFFLVLAHLLVWVILDVGRLDRVWAQVLKQPYVTVGMIAFVLSVPLALTSNNWSLRKLGPLRWRSLHKLTYVIVILGAVHYLWLVKGFQLEPIIYLAVIIGLLAARLHWHRRKRAVA